MPPQNVAAVSLMLRTMAVSSGILAPTISSLPAPAPYLICLFVATAGLIASRNLPAPGAHLSAVEETKENQFKLVDQTTLFTGKDSQKVSAPTNMVFHAMSDV